jgi:hypothetical protein
MCNCLIIRTDSFDLTVTIIYFMNNLMSKWLSYQWMISLCLHSLSLWTFAIVFYERKGFGHNSRSRYIALMLRLLPSFRCTPCENGRNFSLKYPWSSILTPVRTYESIRIVIFYDSLKWSSTFHLFYRKNYLTLHL